MKNPGLRQRRKRLVKAFDNEIRSLLQKYGAAKLSQIDPDHYKALLADAEVLTNGK